MEETRALLDAWIGKYIKQEVAFREGAALPSAAISDLFNYYFKDDTVKYFNIRDYLLMYADQSPSELLDKC